LKTIRFLEVWPRYNRKLKSLCDLKNWYNRDKLRLNNSDLKQVKGFTKDGDILASGWILPKDYGILTYGY